MFGATRTFGSRQVAAAGVHWPPTGWTYVLPTDLVCRHAEGGALLGRPVRAAHEDDAVGPTPTSICLPTDKLCIPQAGREPVVLVSCGRSSSRTCASFATNGLRGRDGRLLQLSTADGDAPAPLGGGQELRERPLPPAISAPGPSSLPAHLRQELAHCCHICNYECCAPLQMAANPRHDVIGGFLSPVRARFVVSTCTPECTPTH